ncbi:MAG: hypothetical protein IPK67_01715 [Planctomycetes bacterium]|nr:hypothetical protein [Planctomycetota bacterium]
MGRATTPEDLRERGVGSLRAVKASEIALLIERAVNRTLMERTLGTPAPELQAELREAAQREFARQLRDLEELKSLHEVAERKRRTQAELDQLREAIAEQRRRVAEPREDAPAAAVDSVLLERRLLDRLAGCLGPIAAEARAKEALGPVLRSLRELVDQQVAEGLARERQRHEVELERQERRVRKLLRSLERTESLLMEFSAGEEQEAGIGSGYRTVQGLSLEDGKVERKQAMMQRILQANLDLRTRLQ